MEEKILMQILNGQSKMQESIEKMQRTIEEMQGTIGKMQGTIEEMQVSIKDMQETIKKIQEEQEQLKQNVETNSRIIAKIEKEHGDKLQVALEGITSLTQLFKEHCEESDKIHQRQERINWQFEKDIKDIKEQILQIRKKVII